MPSFINGVRSEFNVSDIEYSRDGGWFLTYRKAALLTILVMGLCLFSGYIGHQSSDQVVYIHDETTIVPPTPEEDKVISQIVFVAEDGAKVEIKTAEDQTLTKFTRLPQEVVPLQYDLHFVFYESLEHHAFRVEVNVTLQPLLDGLEEIVMHARSLEFADNIKLVNSHENVTIKVNLEEVALHRQTIKLKLDRSISRSEKYKLTFHITGNVGDSTWDSGVFRGKYTDEKDQVQFFMMTKFDPTGARQAFPCFDEPNYKSAFKVSVTHPKMYSCLFNTARTRNVSDSGTMTTTYFEMTPRMPTYLLSFFIGNLTAQTLNQTVPQRKTPLSLRLWRRSPVAEQLLYMLEAVSDVVQHLYDQFGVSLPLGKLDLVVVPEFNVSAVENWGVIYLRESDCKVDELSSFERKRTLYILIAHSLAHHWLGDLVTFKNWTSVWFYESLASSTADNALVTRDLSKIWPNEELKLVQRKSSALHADSALHTRSIQTNTEESILSGDLYNTLDALTYSKGVFILDMLKSAISEQVYSRAVQMFLKSWNFSNADEMDFAESLTEALDKPLVWASNDATKSLKDVMKTWMSNEGFPVVHVTRDENKRDVMKFKQEWFYYEKPKYSKDEKEKLWCIPITLTTLTKTDFNETARFWLDKQEYKYRIQDLEEDNWIIVNLKFGGFYRVNYDLPNWSLLLKEIHRGASSVLSSLTKAQLMDDAFALARNGMLSYEVPLNMTKVLRDNSTYVTWAIVLNNVRYFRSILSHENHSIILEQYLNLLMSDVYDRLSYGVSLSYQEELLLTEISEWSCRFALPACVSTMNKTYHENGYELIKTLHTDQMIGIILCTVVRESADKEWNILWDTLTLNTTDSTLSSKHNDTLTLKGKDDKYPILLRSLACSKNHARVEQVLDKMLEESSSAAVADLWTQLSSDPDTSILMFNWFRSNWNDKIKASAQASVVIAGCIQGLTTTNQLLQLKKFLTDHSEDDVIKGHEPLFTSLVQVIESKISWRTRYSFLVKKWLRAYVDNHH